MDSKRAPHGWHPFPNVLHMVGIHFQTCSTWLASISKRAPHGWHPFPNVLHMVGIHFQTCSTWLASISKRAPHGWHPFPNVLHMVGIASNVNDHYKWIPNVLHMVGILGWLALMDLWFLGNMMNRSITVV